MSLLRSHGDRRRALLVFSLAAWLGAIPSLAVVHLQSSPHWYCPEHLRYEEMQVIGRTQGPLDPFSDPSRSGLGRDSSASVRTHVRCDIAGGFIGGTALSPSAQLATLPCLDLETTLPPDRRGFAPILVLVLAPKHSPPLAPLA